MGVPDFKIENFHKEYKDRPFPHWEEVPGPAQLALVNRLTHGFGIGTENPREALEDLWRSSEPVNCPNAEESAYCLQEVIRGVGIAAQEKVYVLWWLFGEIDQFSLSDLSRYWEYIWYPASDWIMIFDESLCWVLTVGPRGQTWFRRNAQRQTE